MKKMIKLILIFAIVICNQSLFGQSVSWDFGASGTLSATGTTAGIITSNASFGAGISGLQFVNANSSSGGKALQAFGWSLTNDIETNDYYEFCITNDSEEEITIDQFSFWSRRGGTGNGPKYHQLDYAIDGGSGVTLITDGWNSSASTGSTHSTFTSIAVGVGSEICFTVYGYGAQKTNGTLLIDDATVSISGIVLPVEFVSFEANIKAKTTILSWSTSSEINNDYFEVQHSLNGKDYKSIGQVNAMGDHSRNQDYDFIHNTPLNGNNYYRLKQVDLDGSFAYSDVVLANINGVEKSYNILPTLVQNNIDVTFLGEQAHFILTNMSGQVLVNQTMQNSSSIDLSQLTKGIYVVILNIDGQIHIEKIIKQ